MRNLCLFGTLAFTLACGGGSTDTVPTRYNFAVVDGRNQQVTAQASAPAVRVTSMLTRDPQGTFASRALDRVGDFVLPALAYAQGLVLKGEPVADQIVCGREANPGEPQIVPLCAFTLADGKAANSVVGGTKAGTYQLKFTAQVATQEPVEDSTAFTVAAGPAIGAGGGQCNTGQPGCYLVSVGDVIDLHITMTRAWDQYDNPVDLTTVTPGYAIRGPCGDGQPNCFPAPANLTPEGTGWLVTIDKQWAGTKVFLYVFIGANVVNTWPLQVQ